MEGKMNIVNVASFATWAVLVGLVGLMIGAYASVQERISFVEFDTPQYRVSYVAAKQDAIDGIFMDERGLWK